MNLNLPKNLAVEVKITAEQLKQLISEAVLKDQPNYSRAEVSFCVDNVYDRSDAIIGRELKYITVSLSSTPVTK